MHDDSCDAILYADGKECLRFHAGMITMNEAEELSSKSMQHCLNHFEHEEVPEPINPLPLTQRDNLEIRMRLEKIPFFEAVRLMGLKRAIRYQFHGK